MAHNVNRGKRKTSKHHILPRSRINGGDKDKDNIVTIDNAFHRHWHMIFENMTVEEVHKFIDLVMMPGEVWTARRLAMLREKLVESAPT